VGSVMSQSLEENIREIDAALKNVKKQATMDGPTWFQHDLEELQKVTWSEGDYRECRNVVSCVWDSDWMTIFGETKEGNSGIVVTGFDLSSVPRAGYDYTLPLNFLVRGNVKVGDSSHVPTKGEYVLLRVRDLAEERDASREQVMGMGKLRVVDYGYSAEAPPGAKETPIDLKRARATAYAWATNTMSEILKTAIAKRDKILDAESQAKQAEQEKLRVQAAKKAEMEDKLFQADFVNATNGVDSSQYRLGMRYLNGEGVDKDENTGKQWLEKASTQGNMSAKAALAALAYNIDINDKIIMSEVKYAVQDASIYQYKLGLRFLNGDGVPTNSKFAKDWLAKAAGNGNADAKTALSTLPP